MGIEVPSMSKFASWSKSYQDNIRIYLEISLKEFGIDYSKGISYSSYIAWIQKNPQLIQVSFGYKFITIATNFISLDDIEFVN